MRIFAAQVTVHLGEKPNELLTFQIALNELEVQSDSFELRRGCQCANGRQSPMMSVADMLDGRPAAIHAERDRKLEAAWQLRAGLRAAAHQEPC
jgi:hypothetical protein